MAEKVEIEKDVVDGPEKMCCEACGTTLLKRRWVVEAEIRYVSSATVRVFAFSEVEAGRIAKAEIMSDVEARGSIPQGDAEFEDVEVVNVERVK